MYLHNVLPRDEIDRLWKFPEHRQLFALVWLEALDPYTNVSWQVRTTNIRTILEELIHVARISESYPRYSGNMEPLLEEARYVASRDPVVVKHFGFASSYLKAVEPKDHAGVRRTAAILQGLLRSYPAKLADDLRSLLLPDSTKEKDLIAGLASALATDRHCHGYARDYLRRLAGALLPDQPFEQNLAAFFEACSHESPRAYDVYFQATLPNGLFASGAPVGLRLTKRPEGSLGEERFFTSKHVDVEFA